MPPEKVQEVVPCIPKQCEACAGLLHGRDPEPHRHQVFELSPVEPIVTEYQQHALDCRLCNHRTIGVLVTDRHGAYHGWPDCRRQFCWAHLKRDIQTIVEREGESGRIGKGMLDEVERMFTWWHRVSPPGS